MFAAYLAEIELSSLELLYRGTVQGWYAAEFHSKFEGKGRILVLVETAEGMKVGG